MKGIVLLIMLLGLPVGVWGGGPEVDAIVKPGVPIPQAAVFPITAREDFGLDGYFELAPLDLEEVWAADEARASLGKGALRIGIFRELPRPLDLADYPGAGVKTRSGGEARVFLFHSPGAKAIRLEVSGLRLPEGAAITVYAYFDPSQARGPFTRSFWGERESFWTDTIFSDYLALEISLPPGTSETPQFRVERLVHIYRSLPQPDSGRNAAGPCNNDVSCAEPDWRVAANAVAGIGTIGDGGSIWCTGALLNNTAGDFTDYFMTAHHCIENQGEADTTEFYWFYQTPSCNVSPPDPAKVPRTTGGADYLASRPYNNGNDFAFLRLRRSSPAGVTYLGWVADTWAKGTAIRGIHHPEGDFKRISYGSLVDSDTDYWNVRWKSGVTEPGSSGSPLIEQAGRRFIGQLYGGYSSCPNPTGIDFYGRFNRSWPLIKQWLDPPAPVVSPAPKLVSGDYNGNGKSEVAVFRPASGLWAIRSLTRFYFGGDDDFPVSGDYNGDGTTNPAIFRPVAGLWAVRGVTRYYFGSLGDLPAPADYRGDGTARSGIFRGSGGLWAVRNLTRVYFGRSGDLPLPGDYSGNGTAQIACFCPANGFWAVRSLTRFYYGSSRDTPVPGYYNGPDILWPAVYRPERGAWAVRKLTRIYFGGGSDYPLPAAYSGTGWDVPGIFRESSGLWALRGLSRLYYGQSGDLPIAK